MHLVDTHCHLDVPDFDGDRELVIRDAGTKGVVKFVIPGVGSQSLERQLAVCRQWPGCLYPAYGCHPYSVAEQAVPDEDAFLAAFHCTDASFVAVGETGLDGRFAETLPEQSRLFAMHLRLARREGLPLIVHAVRAHQRVLEMLADNPGCRGVVHGFSGSLEIAMRYVRQGFNLGVGGVVTYPSADKTRRALAAVPLTSLVLETDAPDMAPAEVKGRNSPANLPVILRALAALRARPEADMAEICWRNSLALFPRIS